MVKFTTFEKALKVSITAEEGSNEQDEAIIYCLNNALADLKEKLQKLLPHKKESCCYSHAK